MSRCFWLLMCAAHAPALIGVFETYIEDGMMAGPLGGCLALSVCMVFFVLKTFDVPFLRLNLDRRAWVTVVLAVGLVHHDCLGADVDSAALANCVAIVATTSFVSGLILVAQARRRFLAQNTRASVAPILIGCYGGNNWLGETRPCCWVLALGLFLLRAPPA